MQPITCVDLIYDHYNLDAIELLCFRLKIEYEDLDGTTRSKKVLSLYSHLTANGRLLNLLMVLKRERPNLAADLPYCLHEFIAEQFATEQKVLDLFAALNLEINQFPNTNNYPVGQRAWRADKAEQLQIYMAETEQWDRLLQVVAAHTDDHISLTQLREVFALETKTPASPPLTPVKPVVEHSPFPFDPFLQLDFVPQHVMFHQHANEPMAAFAILGLPGTYLELSLGLLLKRLLVWITPETAVSRLTPAVNFLPTDPDAIWKQIAGKVGLGQAGFSFPLSDEDKRKIAQGVFNRLQTQHVIFIFERINDDLVKLLIRHFWEQLVAEVETLRQNNDSNKNTKLLAFLVDNHGRVSEDVLADIPVPGFVILPRVTRLTRQDLLNWLFNIPMSSCDPRFREFAHKPQIENLVLEKSSGVPEVALDFICSECGYDFYEEFGSWLQS